MFLRGKTIKLNHIRSTSISKSASALAALIRVSLTVFRQDIYVNVSRTEPIFHLETLAGSHACSHREQKWFLLLVKLARETVIVARAPSLEEIFDPVLKKKTWQVWPSPETALLLRQTLRQALKEYRCLLLFQSVKDQVDLHSRSSGLDSLDITIGNACAICTEAVSTCIDRHTRGDAHMNILETVYFTIIFVLRSIHELADLARITVNSHIFMILQTLAFWIDAILFRILNALDVRRHRFDIDELKAMLAFCSLVVVYVSLVNCLFKGCSLTILQV